MFQLWPMMTNLRYAQCISCRYRVHWDNKIVDFNDKVINHGSPESAAVPTEVV